jgi:hypothetical protein
MKGMAKMGSKSECLSYRYIFVILLPFLLFSSAYVIAAEKMNYEAKVGLFITASEDIKSQVESYLSRELRSLNDVILTKDDYHYNLTVLAMNTYDSSGKNLGLVFSVTVHEKFDNKILSTFFKDILRDAGMDLTKNLLWDHDHYIQTGAKSELKYICEKIVANFDSRILIKDRETFRLFNK